MTTVIKNYKKNKQKFQIFCEGMEPAETDMSSHYHEVEIRVRLCFGSTLSAGREEVKTRVNFSQGNEKIVTICGSQFVILFTQPLRSGRIWHKVNF